LAQARRLRLYDEARLKRELLEAEIQEDYRA
jgi:hypothetical protein